MILVAGGTGVLGGAIARRLLESGRPTRRRERARALEERGAEVVVGDLRDRASLDTACRGATHVEQLTGRRGARTHLPVPLLRVVGTILRPFNPVFARQVRAGALIATVPQTFDPAPMLARFPVRLTRLEEWVRARYGRLQNGHNS